MAGYACGSGGVMFVADEIERVVSASSQKMQEVAVRLSNDNAVEDGSENLEN